VNLPAPNIVTWPDDRVFDVADLLRRQQITDRLLAAEGAGHLVHDLPLRADGRPVTVASRPWRLDPIPIELDASMFDYLADRITRRMQAFESILVDLYTERRLVREGIVPGGVLFATPRYRLSAIGRRLPHRWLTTMAVDCVELDDGTWRLVGDLTDAPSGLGYAVLNRAATARAFPEALGVDARQGVAPLRSSIGTLHRALIGMAEVESPRVVVFSGGHDHESYVEHSYLAALLGFHTVEGADLVVRDRRVWLRTLGQLEPVDVIYRRIDDSGVDPLDVAPTATAGVPGLLRASAAGGVVMANAHGSGLLESPELRPFLDDAAVALGHRPLDLPVLQPHERSRIRWHPVLRGGQLVSLQVVLRLQAIADGDRIEVVMGGTGRVLELFDEPAIPTACLAKDVWVRHRVVRTPWHDLDVPQVDLSGSVPTRAADALYWMNTAAERSEAIARAVRVVTSRLEQDPWIADDDFTLWSLRITRLLRAVRGLSPESPAAVITPSGDALFMLRVELNEATSAVIDQVGTMLGEAVGVGEYLPATAGRVLVRLAELRSSMAEGNVPVDRSDALIAELAALAGLWHESTVRGPAWWLGDVGRRLERCLISLGSVEAALGADQPANPDVTASTVETVLAANESLVAYRRRHRSTVEVRAATDLLLRDASNPRSFAAAIHATRTQLEQLGWPDGVRLADRAIGAVVEPEPLTLIPLARSTVHEIAAGISERWFAAPVKPVAMRGGAP
jgi:uncharacterized circularly permuted ATP-grasp superfamily protein/uncharacterized alpha-E superfamily protein